MHKYHDSIKYNLKIQREQKEILEEEMQLKHLKGLHINRVHLLPNSLENQVSLFKPGVIKR